MGCFLYVGNLGAATTEISVREAFAAGGHPVQNVVIMRSPQTDRSRGFGFVEFTSEDAATSATQAMNGAKLEGQELKVGPARERAPDRRQGGFQSYSGLGGRPFGTKRPGGAGAKRKRK